MSPTMDMIQEDGYPGILSVEDAKRRFFVERLRGGKTVFTNGVFDILHRGHLEYLRAARKLGTVLIVGLNSDQSVRRIKGPKRPLVPEIDRASALISLRFVDHVVLFDEETPLELIRKLEPSVLVKGGDYKPADIVGADVVAAYGGRVEVIPFQIGYSTSDLIRKIVEAYA